jgi:hypothetical protein
MKLPQGGEHISRFKLTVAGGPCGPYSGQRRDDYVAR